MASNPDEEWQAQRDEGIASFLPKGQAGNWQRLLTEQDKSIFKEIAGEMLIKWNYEKDLELVGKCFGDVMTSDQSKRWRSSVFVAVIAALVFLPLFWAETMIGTKGDSDFPLHVLYALDIKNGRPIPAFIIAHSAWQFLLLAFNAVLGLSFQSAD